MKHQSLMELIEAAEELISREAVQRPSTSGSRVPAMLIELKQRMMRELPDYLASEPDALPDPGASGPRASAMLAKLKERVKRERPEYVNSHQVSSISISNNSSVNVNISIGGNNSINAALQQYNWGLSLLYQNMLKGAEDAFKKVVGFDPKFVGAHSSLGFVYFKQGRLDDAVSEYLAETRLDPKNAQTHYNLASVLHYQGKLDEAKKQYQIAASLGYNAAKEMLAKLEAAK